MKFYCSDCTKKIEEQNKDSKFNWVEKRHNGYIDWRRRVFVLEDGFDKV